MNRSSWLLPFLLIAMAFKSFGQEKDSIYLYNGQILIGNIKSASLGAISIDEVDLKMLSIKLYKIRRLRITHRFKIETVDKNIFHANFEVSEKPGWIIILPYDTLGRRERAIPLHITDIYQLISLDKNIFKRMNGDLSAGLSFTKSSGIGQVNLSATVNFAAKRFEYQLSASEIGSIDSSKYSRDNETIQLFAGYDITPSWFFAGMGQYQRNLELSIARRYLGMLGGGNKLVVTDDLQLLALTGMSISEERSTNNVYSGVLFEIPLMLRFNFYKFQHPNIQISTTPTAYFSLTEQGRFRFDGNTSFKWELIRYFYLSLSPYTSYDNKPPSGTGSKFDFGIVFSLTYKF